jgi:hypothetical protein
VSLCAAPSLADEPKSKDTLIAVAPEPPKPTQRDASLDDYRKHLLALTTIVEACSKARDNKTCDPMLVGPDDRVTLGTGAQAPSRLIRFGWLRVLLEKAQDKDAPPPKPPVKSPAFPAPIIAQPPPRSTTDLLKDAEIRLAHDLAQTDAIPAAPPAHPAEAAVLKQVLAGREFRNLRETPARDTWLEKLGNWINSFFDVLARTGVHAPWIGAVLYYGFIGVVCVALVWGLIQLERRWRIRLVPDGDRPAADAASARDWQLWLEDARRAAAAGQWREAIHFVYWASISRLESRRLWPADRARTPREYLALVAPEDPRKEGLRQLTGSFERTWYGGRAAGESEYQRAEELAVGLISGHAAAGGGAG